MTFFTRWGNKLNSLQGFNYIFLIKYDFQINRIHLALIGNVPVVPIQSLYDFDGHNWSRNGFRHATGKPHKFFTVIYSRRSLSSERAGIFKHSQRAWFKYACYVDKPVLLQFWLLRKQSAMDIRGCWYMEMGNKTSHCAPCLSCSFIHEQINR